MSYNEYGLAKIPGTLGMTKLKNALVKIDPALTVALKNERVNGQLQGCSGFVTNPSTGNIVYVSTDCNHGTSRGALYRTATTTRDFSGGANRFAAYDELPRAVVELLAK
jgi:hypothetical protein